MVGGRSHTIDVHVARVALRIVIFGLTVIARLKDDTAAEADNDTGELA